MAAASLGSVPTPAPPAPAPAAYQVQPSAAPPRKTSAWVWVIVAILGLMFLGILGVGAATYWFVRNPGLALGKVITAANPDVEVLNVDNARRRITIRNRRDGSEVTVSFDDVKNGRISFSGTDEHGKTGRVEIGGGAGKLPSWLPVYPGAKIESHLTGSGMDGDNAAEGGFYAFTSSDSPAQVMSFYQDRAKELGMKVELTTATAEGGHFSAADGEDNRSLVVLVTAASGGGASGTVTFGRKR